MGDEDDEAEDGEDEDDSDNSRELVQAMLAAGKLTGADVDKLKIQLLSQPRDLPKRITVCRYYQRMGSSFDSERIEHVLWIIANHPDLSKFVAPTLAVQRDSDAYDRVKAAWLDQIENHPAKVRVLINAAFVFRSEDDFALRLLEEAHALVPADLDVEKDLANHYRRRALTDDVEAAKINSAIALAKYEYILSQSADVHKRFYQLTDVATTAFGAGNLHRANEIAQEMLRVAPNFTTDWNHGNAIFWANIVLGKIALGQNDIDGACGFLLAASETPGSPQLDSFGPEFVLCAQLLSFGKSKLVKNYLNNCSKFWDMDEGRLSQWIEDIDNGVTPSFSKRC